MFPINGSSAKFALAGIHHQDHARGMAGHAERVASTELALQGGDPAQRGRHGVYSAMKSLIFLPRTDGFVKFEINAPVISMMKLLRGMILCFWLATVAGAMAGQYTKTRQSTRLYTAPDSSAGGGIHARLTNSSKLILHVFAIPINNPLHVYKGTVSADGFEFSFKGLPVAKYDLVVVFPDQLIEGFTLSMDPDTLTDKDRQYIETIIMKSIPFFDTKRIHRCIGTTGTSGKARCVLQEVRTRPITLQSGVERADIQVRSIKLAFLEDAGSAGWQLVQTREILRTEVAPGDKKGVLLHAFNPLLSGIRVTDGVKDLGDIQLTKNALFSGKK